jgi:hypothetical protein
MMPNIVRGGRMAGLLVYLAGPGRANEHTNPHVVAGDIGITAFDDGSELSRDDALGFAKFLDGPRRQFGTEVKVPVKEWNEAEQKMVTTGFKDADVWHCSLSLRAEEGQLDDAQWSAIATDFVREMGFAGEGIGKADCRWVAIRHGLSKAGNDHVHIAVSLVREDGTKASVHNDFRRAQKLCGELEERYGLEVVSSRSQERGSRGYSPAEQRDGEPTRLRVGRTVRACANAAATEAEFVRRCRAEGLLMRPRYAQGRTDVVVGYSAAERPTGDAKPVWFGGGRLARDLTLPRLRQDWPDTPEHAAEAAREWRAPAREWGEKMSEGRRQVLAEQAAKEVAELRKRLASVPPGDRATWAKVAGETAGAFAAWSRRVESEPGPLARTANLLSECAQLHARPARVERTPVPSARGAALVFLSIAHGGRGGIAEAILLRQLMNTMRALFECAQALADMRTAQRIEVAVRTDLAGVAAGLPRPPSTSQGTDSEVADVMRLTQLGRPTTTRRQAGDAARGGRPRPETGPTKEPGIER